MGPWALFIPHESINSITNTQPEAGSPPWFIKSLLELKIQTDLRPDTSWQPVWDQGRILWREKNFKHPKQQALNISRVALSDDQDMRMTLECSYSSSWLVPTILLLGLSFHISIFKIFAPACSRSAQHETDLETVFLQMALFILTSRPLSNQGPSDWSIRQMQQSDWLTLPRCGMRDGA